jgi:hypothetical protein
LSFGLFTADDHVTNTASAAVTVTGIRRNKEIGWEDSTKIVGQATCLLPAIVQHEIQHAQLGFCYLVPYLGKKLFSHAP